METTISLDCKIEKLLRKIFEELQIDDDCPANEQILNVMKEKMEVQTINLTNEQLYETIGYLFIDFKHLFEENKLFKNLPDEVPFAEALNIKDKEDEAPRIIRYINSRAASAAVTVSVPKKIVDDTDKMEEIARKMDKKIAKIKKSRAINITPIIKFFWAFTTGEIKSHKDTTLKGIEILYSMKVPKEYPVAKEEFCEEYKKIAEIATKNATSESEAVDKIIDTALEKLVQCTELGELGDFGFNEIREYDMYETSSNDDATKEMYDNVALAIKLKKEAMLLEENYKRILEIKELDDFNHAVMEHKAGDITYSVEKIKL